MPPGGVRSGESLMQNGLRKRARHFSERCPRGRRLHPEGPENRGRQNAHMDKANSVGIEAQAEVWNEGGMIWRAWFAEEPGKMLQSAIEIRDGGVHRGTRVARQRGRLLGVVRNDSLPAPTFSPALTPRKCSSLGCGIAGAQSQFRSRPLPKYFRKV